MLLERLSNACAPLGYEGEVRQIIIGELNELNLSYKIDLMGNVIVHKKGSGPTILINSNMDEAGFIVSSINEDGSLNFAPLGRFYKNSILSSEVSVGHKKLPGVIGTKPIHLQSLKERDEEIEFSNCFIDIGANSKKEAESYVDIGDFVVLKYNFRKLKKDTYRGRALKSRVPCIALIELLKKEYDCDLYAIFSVQGNKYMRGIMTAAYNIKAETLISIDTVDQKIEKGPYIALINSNSINNNVLINKFINLSKESNIECVFKGYLENASGIGNISSLAGKSISISIPLKHRNNYINIASLKDLDNTINIISMFLKKGDRI